MTTLTSRDKLQFSRRDYCVSQIRDIYSHAHHFGLSRSRILDDIRTRVWETKAYKSLPRYMQEYVKGAAHVMFNSLYHVGLNGEPPALVFGAWIDGKFYSTHRNRGDYYERNGIEPSAFAKLSENKVAHYWAHKTDCIF